MSFYKFVALRSTPVVVEMTGGSYSPHMAGCMIEEHIVALVGLVQTIISKNIAKYFVR